MNAYRLTHCPFDPTKKACKVFKCCHKKNLILRRQIDRAVVTRDSAIVACEMKVKRITGRMIIPD